MKTMNEAKRLGVLLCFAVSGSLQGAESVSQTLDEKFEERQVIEVPVLPPGFPLSVSASFSADFTGLLPMSDTMQHVTGELPEAGQRTIWFSWTAPKSSWFEVSNSRSNLRTIAAVYQGVDRTSLTAVAVPRVETIRRESKVYFEAVAGERYEIAVADYSGARDGVVSGTIGEAYPSTNRYNEPRVAIEVASSLPATFSADAVPSRGRSEYGVWFCWSAPEAGLYRFTNEFGVGLGRSGYKVIAWSPSGSGSGDLVELKQGAGRMGAEFFEVTDGEKLFFEVTGGLVSSWGSSTQALSMRLNLAGVTPNDDFADSVEVVGQEGAMEGSSVRGSLELGEPSQVDPDLDHRSMWWHWTAPADGRFNFQAGGALATRVSAFTGSRLDRLELAAAGRNWLDFPVLRGERYQLRVSTDERSLGEFAISWKFLPVAENDLLISAEDLGSGEVTEVTGSWVQAGLSVDEPQPIEVWIDRSVWYRWKTEERVIAAIESQQSSGLSVFRDLGSGVMEPVKADQGYDYFAFPAEPGTDYLIRMGGQSEGAFQFEIKTLDPLPNDDIENALVLESALMVRSEVSNLAATAQPGEDGERSVWWRWAAPSTSQVEVRASPGREGLLKIFTGDGTIGGLEEVMRTNYEHRFHRILQVEEGTVYWISADMPSVGDGVLQLWISPHDTSWIAPNTFFADATDLGSELTGGGDFPSGRTFTEEGEPVALDGRNGQILDLNSMWWTWTAPESTTMELVFLARRSDDEDVFTAVWTGDSLADLTQIAGGGNEDAVLLRFSAVAGTTYRISAGADFADGICLMIRPASPLHHFLTELPEQTDELEDLWEESYQEDGVTNLERFIFNLDPLLPLSSDPNAGNLPSISMSGEFLELRYRVRPELANGTGSVTVMGQCSTDGLVWEDIEPEDLGDGNYVVRTPIEEGIPCKLLRVDYRIMELGLPMQIGGGFSD